jgi:hypothetical protein
MPIRSEYYPLEKGYRWIYRLQDLQQPLAKVEPNRKVEVEVVDTATYTHKKLIDDKTIDVKYAGFVLQSTSGDKSTRAHVFVNENGVHRFHDAGVSIEPPFSFLKFGLMLGDKWECRATNGDKSIKGTCSINQDTVSVPYRKGEKLKAVTTHFKSDDGRIEIEYWFVKDIGMVKQRIKGKGVHIVLELEKFSNTK